MLSLDGHMIREIMGMMPSHVFDVFCDEFGDMFTCQHEDWSKWVHWEETSEDYTPDDVAVDYGFENLDDMQDDGTYTIIEFDEGLLLVE